MLCDRHHRSVSSGEFHRTKKFHIVTLSCLYGLVVVVVLLWTLAAKHDVNLVTALSSSHTLPCCGSGAEAKIYATLRCEQVVCGQVLLRSELTFFSFFKQGLNENIASYGVNTNSAVLCKMVTVKENKFSTKLPVTTP